MYKSKTMTAKEMALTSHNLSKDGMRATTANGEVFEWSDAFNCWAGPFPRRATDARRPRQSTHLASS